MKTPSNHEIQAGPLNFQGRGVCVCGHRSPFFKGTTVAHEFAALCCGARYLLNASAGGHFPTLALLAAAEPAEAGTTAGTTNGGGQAE